MHVAGVQADARTYEHIDPSVVGNSRDVAGLRAVGQGHVLARAESAGHRARRRRGQARGRAAQGARAPRLPLRGGRRLVRAAAATRGGRLRAAVPARELPRDHREARGRPGRDRGDDQGLGRAASATSRTAEGNGPVNALDTRAARGDRRAATRSCADIELVNYKVRILDEHHGTGAVTRVLIDSSDGDETWGTIGVSENIIEASLGGAGRLARVRVPAEAAPTAGAEA